MLTFGVQVAEVAVDVETGEVRVERIAAIHDVGRVINPLGASSQVEGGIIQAHRPHALGGAAARPADRDRSSTQTLDAYRLPTIADVPEIVTELLDIPDEHLTNLGSKGLGEPPIVPTAAAIANAIRDATGADVRSLPITREEMLRALREARERTKGEGCSSCGLSPSRRRRRARQRLCRARRRHRARAAPPRRPRRGGHARRLSDVVPRGIDGTRIGAGTTLAELEVDPQIPQALREACRARRLARSSARWARSAATCSRRHAAGTGG